MIRADASIAFLGDRDVPRAEIVVAYLMAIYSDQSGTVVASVADIAQKSGYGRSIVYEALEGLKRRGMIEKTRPNTYVVAPEFCEPQGKDFRSYMAASA